MASPVGDVPALLLGAFVLTGADSEVPYNSAYSCSLEDLCLLGRVESLNLEDFTLFWTFGAVSFAAFMVSTNNKINYSEMELIGIKAQVSVFCSWISDTWGPDDIIDPRRSRLIILLSKSQHSMCTYHHFGTLKKDVDGVKDIVVVID
jgi:hypothetical protein